MGDGRGMQFPYWMEVVRTTFSQEVCQDRSSEVAPRTSYSLNSSKGGYIGDDIGDYFWGY